MSAGGRTVRLFLVDGNAQTGILTAEIINWTGRVLVAPRSRLPDVLLREESKKTGLYMLFGGQIDAGIRRDLYIGESDDVGRRIAQHSKDESKDFFERFCLITSSDLNLTKTHVRYLENKTTAIAKASGRANVLNANEPPAGSLPESDVSDMEFFIEQLRTLLPVLGFDVLRDPLVAPGHVNVTVAANGGVDSGADELELYLAANRDGIEAKAVQLGDEIIVRKGSLARKDPDYAVNHYAGLRQQLIEDGALSDDPAGSYLIFSRDVPFPSPTAAAAVIYGRNDNGRLSWHVAATRQTLKDYQITQAEAAQAISEAAQ